MRTRKKSIGHDEHLKNTLGKHPEEAVEYLNLALQEKDSAGFLMALQDVARAFGGMSALARKTGLNREGLYTALSATGNPEINSLNAILDALGLKITIAAKKARKAPRKTDKRKYALAG